MLGAIAGDIIGSIHEHGPPAPPGTPLIDPRSFVTDDSILTLATMEALLEGEDYARAYQRAWERYPDAGWGGMFRRWASQGGGAPYNSFGNGSAMRVSPVALWFTQRDQALEGAERSAAVTHNHPEGVKGAQAVVDAIHRAFAGQDGAEILGQVARDYSYPIEPSLAALQENSRYNELCQGTVPAALQIACQTESFEECMTTCLALDADTDTLACIAGGIAEARWRVPEWAIALIRERLNGEQWSLVQSFYRTTGKPLGEQRDV
ncbi:ADP-ribosylglycohydrolase family protein [Halorhodospira halochloris]|uniref:ADP-ribosylglycohydrolase family protein n=1 Tax=Halorhodospira halochloris TaxID=1052 RepID=UPI001EE7C8DC|nr:ADP-ribosylglycohydrolase family protein [Halorhodospira halochloris]MCG5549438.1 ADP-ribosylglycohydrolase family protein [Halorhodospira halochloris]